MEVQTLPAQTLKPTIYTRDEHSISRNQIDPDALKIMYRLIRNGYKAFLVGGGVRDLLLGKKPKDFDIATDATPRRIKSLFGNSRIIGRRFKLVHIFFQGGKIIEVSTFRDTQEEFPADDSPESENSLLLRDNKYGNEMTDALRRDLTINGLFYDLSNFSIIDYVGGMNDLRNGIIRVIGNPDARFAEDPVRILRVIRHAARSGFQIEDECWQSINRNPKLITQSVPVRVYEELKKDFTSGYWLLILKLLQDSGVLQSLLPEIIDHRLLEPESHFSSCLSFADELVRNSEEISATSILSLMALFVTGGYKAVGNAEQHLESQGVAQAQASELKRYFQHLAVPRKEKEKIEDILITWQKLTDMSTHRLKLSSLARKPYLEDLLLLARYLGSNEEESDIVQVLSDVKQSVDNGERIRDNNDDDRHSRSPQRPRRFKGRRRQSSESRNS